MGGMASSTLLYYQDTTGKFDIPSIDDRAYRITKNQGQVMADKYSLAGAAAGTVGGVIAGGNILTLAAAGVGLGALTFVAQKKFNENKVENVILREEKQKSEVKKLEEPAPKKK